MKVTQCVCNELRHGRGGFYAATQLGVHPQEFIRLGGFRLRLFRTAVPLQLFQNHGYEL